jgi:ubiquinone/menaquinone biosynthesis C-methylase UbiE
MMSEANALFGGSIAENYHRYLVPLIFEDYARDLARRTRIPADGAVLEIACGTGALTRHLQDAMPETARLVATDVNPDMVDAAKANLGGPEPVAFQPADGTALPFEDDSFDAVVCQFGVMFYPDTGLGYREAARVLKAGGSFAFNTWDTHAHNELCGFVHEQVVRMFPEDPPAFLATPFAYNDISAIKAELQDAGFSDVHLSVLRRESRAPSARAVALGFVAGSPLAAQLAERGVERETLEAVESALVDVYGDGPVAAPMQSIAIVAELAA